MVDRTTIAGYLDALASSAPTPGGGSAAALVNALACSLGEMVAALSPDARERPEVRQAAAELTSLRSTSLSAMARDEAAYGGYIAATRLPKSTADEKATRRHAMQAALIVAAEAPLSLAHTALAALEHFGPVAAHGNKHVLSDARIAALLAEVAVRAALINVRVNAALIKDAATAIRLHNAAAEAEELARERYKEIEAALSAHAR